MRIIGTFWKNFVSIGERNYRQEKKELFIWAYLSVSLCVTF